MSECSQYVVGFMFNQAKTQVALIRKARPAWQAGLLNGIGGHIEPGETPRQAMVREFREETGRETVESDWEPVCIMYRDEPDGFQCDVFRALTTFGDLAGANLRTQTDERIALCSVECLAARELGTLSNVPWLVSMCVDTNPGDFAAYSVLATVGTGGVIPDPRTQLAAVTATRDALEEENASLRAAMHDHERMLAEAEAQVERLRAALAEAAAPEDRRSFGPEGVRAGAPLSIDLSAEGVTDVRVEPLAGDMARVTWRCDAPGLCRVYQDGRLLAVTQKRSLTLTNPPPPETPGVRNPALFEIFREVDRYAKEG